MPEKDNYGRHEAMDRASLALGFVGDYLLEHEQIKETPSWHNLAEIAHTALFELYQSIGAVHLATKDKRKRDSRAQRSARPGRTPPGAAAKADRSRSP